MGYTIFPPYLKPTLIFILPPGAFFVIGIEIAILNHFIHKHELKGKKS
jgi:Na+-translocating ferredoxin:NAD+ oxidoreductase RnfE subunit